MENKVINKRKISVVAKVAIPARNSNSEVKSAIYSETKIKVGSFCDKSGNVKRLLASNIEDRFMPIITGASMTNPSYFQKVVEKYADLEAHVTYDEDGTEFSTVVGDIETKDGLIENGYVEDLNNFLKIQLLKKHPKVAKTVEEYNESPKMYLCYIEDKELIQKNKIESKETKDKAKRLYLDLMGKDVKIETLKYIIEIAKPFIKNENLKGLNKSDIEIIIQEFSEESPTEFISIAENKDLETTAKVLKLIEFEILKKQGNIIFYIDEELGSDVQGTVTYLNSQSGLKTKSILWSMLNEKLKSLM